MTLFSRRPLKHRMRQSAALMFGLFLSLPALAADPWDTALWDPAIGRDGWQAPDLVLPMPCGGAMAFQKVTVSLDASDPLADIRIRLGQSAGPSGHADFLRYGYLRGGFDAPDAQTSFFYMSRYELTVGQARALREAKDCATPAGRRDILAKGDLSWFDALDLSRSYTEWLSLNAPEALPRQDGVPGFLRLPTETEWEFATRGGEAVSQAEFASARFPMQEDLSAYARFDKERLGPVGVTLPNPLGFYDLYGNAEEIMLDPFQMNAVGHTHGQPGGMITRGASHLSGQAQMRSAWRREWGLFGRNGLAQTQPTFGMRLVISAPVETSDTRLRDIRDAFAERLSGGDTTTEQPVDTLAQIIREELDPNRKATLEGLQLALQTARDQAAFAQARQLETSLLAASIFLTSLWDDTQSLSQTQDFIAYYETEIAQERDPAFRAELIDYRDQFLAKQAVVTAKRAQSLTGYDGLLRYLTEDVTAEDRSTAANTLARKLREQNDTALGNALSAVVVDIGIFAQRPDMSPADFLEMVLSQ